MANQPEGKMVASYPIPCRGAAGDGGLPPLDPNPTTAEIITFENDRRITCEYLRNRTCIAGQPTRKEAACVRLHPESITPLGRMYPQIPMPEGFTELDPIYDVPDTRPDRVTLLGNKLYCERRRKGIGAEELAGRVGVSHTYIWTVEHGSDLYGKQLIPIPEVLRKICEELKVDFQVPFMLAGYQKELQQIAAHYSPRT